MSARLSLLVALVKDDFVSTLRNKISSKLIIIIIIIKAMVGTRPQVPVPRISVLLSKGKE